MTPRTVSRFEANLLRLLHFFLGQLPIAQAKPLLSEWRATPPCLSADCVHLVKDALGKGCIRFLVRNGGWRNDRYLKEGTPVPGRVWQRIPLAGRALHFSRAVLDFLIHITAERQDSATGTQWRPAGNLTAGDALFFLIAWDSLWANSAPTMSNSVFSENPLCQLAYPTNFAATDEPPRVDFDSWFTGSRAAILECLQPWLADRWLRMERSMGRETSWPILGRQGRAGATVLDGFLASADRHGRRDLARFVLQSTSAILTVPEISPEFWSGGLFGDGPPRLSERATIRRDAMIGPGRYGTLESWTRQARGVGFFDEGYAASQLWKEDWEAAGGDAAAIAARHMLAEVEPL